MKRNNGFTLVEMLGVITVLFVIAIVAFPALTKSIKNNQEESYNAKTNDIILAATSFNSVHNGTVKQVSVSDLKKYGYIRDNIIDPRNNNVMNGCIYNNNGDYSYEEKVCTTMLSGDKNYITGTIIYFNPETSGICGEGGAKSTPGTKNGCMKWYVVSESNDKVNVILDHNTTAMVAWNSTGSNTAMKEVQTSLSSDTSTWNNSLLPRLITANEVAQITGADQSLQWSSDKVYADIPTIGTNISHYKLDGSNGSNKLWQDPVSTTPGTNIFSWLFDYTDSCTSYGCNIADSSTLGYWTSTPVKSKNSFAWFVSFGGGVYDGTISASNHYGVRPVISILKSLMK